MKRTPNEKLLHDVLREASETFRQDVFEASLKDLRLRRDHTKTWLRLPLAIAAAVVLCLGLLFFSLPHRIKKEDRALLPRSVQTTPISAYARMEIVTNILPGMAIVESRQYPSLIVQTSNIRQPVEILGDTELLALFPGQPAGLIADSQGTVQLVLLDSGERNFRQ